MPGDWGGFRVSGVTLAMRHTLQWFIHSRARGLGKGDEHSTQLRSTQPCIPPGSLNRVPASVVERAGMSPQSGGR